MNKAKNYYGIDISKDVFDVYSLEMGHHQYSNNESGFKELRKSLLPGTCCVMEATGSYHLLLAMYLYENHIPVSVVNPLVIKRYVQMKLRRTKTDKSDAEMIYRYAGEQPLTLWEPEPEHISALKLLNSIVSTYFKQSTALKNTVHSLKVQGISYGIGVRSLRRQLKQLSKEISGIEQEMERLITSNEETLFINLKTIPGIGKKTAMLLISSTNGFKSFENYKQVSSFMGLAPTERRSGSSTRGRTRISKTGNPKVRNHLFMCSFTACKHNGQCRALYERLVAKGKSKKLALIAVCNKLIKQAYGIAKSGLPYDAEYKIVKTTI